MIAFLGVLILAAVLALRGGDRMLLGALSTSGFAWEPPIAVAVLTGGLTSSLAAWAGAQAAGMSGPYVAWVGAGAMLLAGLRFFVPRRQVILREPTRSIFAFASVMAILQAFDAVRLMVFGIAALTGEPLLAACGAFIGAPVGLAQSAPGAGR